VELTCSYTYPSGYTITTTFWFTKIYAEENYVSLKDDPDYKGRVTYREDEENGHTLTITDLRESDSATYMFRFTDQTGGWKYFGKPGVTLSVTGTDPTNIIEGTCLRLFCESICFLQDNPSYIWYKNGQRLFSHETKYLILDPVCSEDAGRYACAVNGQEDLASAEKTLTVRYHLRVKPSGEIVEGSSVTLTCSSDANPPVDKYTWYKKNVTSPKASGQSYNITNIISEDRGEYYCEAENKYGRLISSSVSVDVQCKFT
uniref:B-cell receptor CD22 n=1 Tax=Oncorhynchus tshawytscha TaxID=74940 RepID=A0AAZ3P999_ONCTS